MHQHELMINQLAQGLRPTADGMAWFAGLAEDDRRLVLRALEQFCVQARATEADVPEAIARSGVRPTYSPAVMLTRWRLHMTGLPSYDLPRAFRLLVALLAVADARRRARFCADGCSHAWHHLGPGQVGP
ncbi:DUF5958 family protein [Streptomyces sp. NPDC093272]|uniref:DUF5958 family protein n=1 Tax=Streptomyces sp. NPDC093272 TaxID=3154981 RepID=UPI00342C0DCA